jgi:hypothetical protein
MQLPLFLHILVGHLFFFAGLRPEDARFFFFFQKSNFKNDLKESNFTPN